MARARLTVAPRVFLVALRLPILASAPAYLILHVQECVILKI